MTRVENNRPKLILVAPDTKRQGGMAAVGGMYVEEWDQSLIEMRHVVTAVDGPGWKKGITWVRGLLHFIWLMVSYRPDLVHIHFSWKASFYRKAPFALLTRLWRRTKLVLHCHNGKFDAFYASHPKLGKRFIRTVLNSSDLLLLVSEEQRTFFQQLHLRPQMAVLHNAVPVPQISYTKSDTPPIILTLGRLEPRKGTYDILKAIPLVLDVCPTAQFWFGGDGDVEKVKEMVATQTWQEQVKILGWVRDQQKEDVLLQAHMFLLPSYYEGLPVSILEAMGYGLPVISTPVGEIEAAVIDGETGFLVQPGDIDAIVDRVVLLINNSELRKQMSDNARRHMEETFEIQAMLRKLYEIYQPLLT